MHLDFTTLLPVALYVSLPAPFTFCNLIPYSGSLKYNLIMLPYQNLQIHNVFTLGSLLPTHACPYYVQHFHCTLLVDLGCGSMWLYGCFESHSRVSSNLFFAWVSMWHWGTEASGIIIQAMVCWVECVCEQFCQWGCENNRNVWIFVTYADFDMHLDFTMLLPVALHVSPFATWFLTLAY